MNNQGFLGVGLIGLPLAVWLILRGYEGPKTKLNNGCVNMPALHLRDVPKGKSGPFTWEQRRRVVDATKGLLQVVQRVKVHPHSMLSAPKPLPKKRVSSMETVHVYLSDGSARADSVVPMFVCGLELEKAKRAYPILPDWKVVYDTSGTAIAQVKTNQVRILLELDRDLAGKDAELYKAILTRVRKHCAEVSLTFVPWVNDTKPYVTFDIGIESFIAYSQLNLQRQFLLEQLYKEQVALREQEQLVQSEITNLVQQHTQLAEYDLMIASLLVQSSSLEDELNGLSELESWRLVNDSVLSVETIPLQCKHPINGDTYLLGKYKIKIFLDGSHGVVRCYNLTQIIEVAGQKLQAPHVCESGNMRHSRVTDKFPELLGRFEVGKLVRYVIKQITLIPRDPLVLDNLRYYPRIQ